MIDSSNIRILNSIFDTLKKFRLQKISAYEMISNISGNITALEGLDNEFIDNFQYFIGEIDFIQFTEEENLLHALILKKADDYENYLKSYFKLEKI